MPAVLSASAERVLHNKKRNQELLSEFAEPVMPSKLRIVHLGKFYPPDSGGIESVTQVLAEGHAARGHEVTVLCFTTSEPCTQMLRGVRVHRIKTAFSMGSQPFGWGYVRKGVSLAQSADIVHVHVPNVLASAMSGVLSSTPRVIVHWHSDILGKGIAGHFASPISHAMLRRADGVIATSEAYVAGSPFLRTIKEKVCAIPIGIRAVADRSCHASLPAAWHEFLGARKLVLGVGRLVAYKGFQFLIEAVKHLPGDAAILIAGDGPLRLSLESHIQSEGLTTRVNLVGRVTDEELNALFARASVFCLPSIERSEAFGVVLLEAMARGVPAVATLIDGSGTGWVNEHGISGLNVPVQNALALAGACCDILQSEELRARLSEGAKRRFETLFVADKFIEKVERFYVNATLNDSTARPRYG